MAEPYGLLRRLTMGKSPQHFVPDPLFAGELPARVFSARRLAGRSAIEHVVQTFFEGSVGSAVAALLETGDTRLSHEEIERLQKLVDPSQAGRKGVMNAPNAVMLLSSAEGLHVVLLGESEANGKSFKWNAKVRARIPVIAPDEIIHISVTLSSEWRDDAGEPLGKHCSPAAHDWQSFRRPDTLRR